MANKRSKKEFIIVYVFTLGTALIMGGLIIKILNYDWGALPELFAVICLFIWELETTNWKKVIPS